MTESNLPPLALAALTKGNKIEAIKIVRQELGVDLKTAKDTVDDYLRTHPDLAANSTSAVQGGCVVWLLSLLLLAAIVWYLFFRAA